MRIALAQLNVTVGDLEGNRKLIEDAVKEAREEGAALVAFPELAVTGYPPEDLLLKPSFIRDNLACLRGLTGSCAGIAAVVGFVDQQQGGLYNAAALISDGEIRHIYHKQHLPNYGVFDEARYFQPGRSILVAEAAGASIGVTVCEDLWSDDGPHIAAAAAGAGIIVNINASPYHRGKGLQRQELVSRRARESGTPLAYVNMVGGQDELVFDGQSLLVSADGALLARASQFTQEILIADLPSAGAGKLLGKRAGGTGSRQSRKERPGGPLSQTATRERPADSEAALPGDYAGARGAGAPGGRGAKTFSQLVLAYGVASELREEAEVYRALVLGLRDYLAKNGFTQALVGISGGIDSALTAAIAVDALTPANVLGVSNPSDYTSGQSVRDARALAENLGIELVTLPISHINSAVLKTLDSVFARTQPGVPEENIQARIRGLLWMAISNKSRRIVLPTGNKSELSVGYATLYGDMAGGYAVLKDVPKTFVYRLAKWRNTQGAVVPESIMERPPTAELRPGQLDTDSLPPYEILDPILEAYVERDVPIEEIVEMGFEQTTVEKVAQMVDRAEYKRRQAPPGIKITERAFGKDRRLPITNAYGRIAGFSLPR